MRSGSWDNVSLQCALFASLCIVAITLAMPVSISSLPLKNLHVPPVLQ